MATQTKSNKQTIYYWVFTLIILGMVSALLLYNVQTRLQSYNDNQKRLMTASVTSVSNDITSMMKELRRMVELFSDQHQVLLKKVVDDPENQDVYDELETLVSEYFPFYFSFTLASPEAEVLLDDFDGFVGEVCRNDIKGFVANPHQPQVFIHPNSEGYHFDIMSAWGEDKNILFVSFKVEDLTRLLKNNQLPNHQLILVKIDKPDLIEVTAEGPRIALTREINLSPDELQRIGYTAGVKDTLWNLLDLPDADLFLTEKKIIEKENALMFFAFLVIALMLLALLLFEHKKNTEAQAQLIQSSKMAALGQMVAGIAHEINTPLGYVSSNIDMVANQVNEFRELNAKCDDAYRKLKRQKNKTGKVSPITEGLFELLTLFQEDQILDDLDSLTSDSKHGLERISELVQSLKDFSRMDRQQVDGFNLNDGIDSTLTIANNIIKNKLEVIKEFADIPEVSCSPSQINQVLLNIITNAAQAMEDQGTLQITTGVSDKFVYVKIKDDGAGISKKDLGHIFEPFFTTKAIGEGTGLGLSISYRIIEEHKGKIEVKSTVGEGTEFTVSLPLQA